MINTAEKSGIQWKQTVAELQSCRQVQPFGSILACILPICNGNACQKRCASHALAGFHKRKCLHDQRYTNVSRVGGFTDCHFFLQHVMWHNSSSDMYRKACILYKTIPW